jgi:DNA recombination protein RmuC
VTVSILLLILGLLLGAAVAVVLGRRGNARDEEARRADERERLRDELKAISLDVLQQTGDSLAQRLGEARRAEEERASGEMARRAEEIKGLVELSQMVRQLHEGVGSLRLQTGNLVSALKRPTTRGSWGEIQLRNVIEMAGMVAHCDFVEQSTIHTDDGRLRPDVLVRLPGGKVIVIDSKVPLDAYLAAIETAEEDSQQRELHLARHARQTRDHITKLASKGYQRQFDSTPELVVMFVPSDGIHQAALAEDPALIEYGVAQQVLMATPTTLIGLLRAVHYGWRQEQIALSAREIAESARELHGRIGRFVEPFAQIGRRLDSAVSAYNEAVGSFDHRVVPQLRRIEQAGAASEREIAAPPAVQSGVRPLTARLEPEARDAPPAQLPGAPRERRRPAQVAPAPESPVAPGSASASDPAGGRSERAA